MYIAATNLMLSRRIAVMRGTWSLNIPVHSMERKPVTLSATPGTGAARAAVPALLRTGALRAMAARTVAAVSEGHK